MAHDWERVRAGMISVRIPQSERSKYHTRSSCICVAYDKHVCIKAKLNHKRWVNTVSKCGKFASISRNKYTPLNDLVPPAKGIHLITYTSGAGTFYRGLFKCVECDGKTFSLERIGRGDADKLETINASQHGFRSNVEKKWHDAFGEADIATKYEKMVFNDWDGEGSSYNPDFWLVDHKIHVEIKHTGDTPDESEFKKCAYVSSLNNEIVLFDGPPTAFTCYTWKPGEAEPKKAIFDSVTAWLSSRKKRKRMV